MARFPANYAEIVATHPAFDALWNFIQNDYPTRNQMFCTSWSSYAISSTTEEDLLDEAFAELYDADDIDYLLDLPSLITRMICTRAKKISEQTRALAFLTDAIADLVMCHVRDNDTDLEDDETDVAA